MTKTIELDELIHENRWFHAVVEGDFSTIDEDWHVSELCEYFGDDLGKEVVHDVNKLDKELESFIIEAAKDELSNSQNWPTDAELKEEAYDNYHGI